MTLSTVLLAKSVAGALTGTGLVAAAVLGVQHSAPGSSTATSTVAAHPGGHGTTTRCHSHGLHVGKAPEALERDLAAARAKLRTSDAKGAARRQERRAAFATIRKAALDGTYGTQVQQRLEAHQKRAEQRRAALPAKLRSDLDAVKKMDRGPARREAAKKVREGRLDGTYGAEVRERAQKHQQHRAACREQRHDTKEQSGSTTS